MKKLLYSLLIGLSVMGLRSEHALLECPKSLSLKNLDEIKRFGLTIKRDLLKDADQITQIYIEGNFFFNKNPLLFSQKLHFYDDYTLEEVVNFLDKTILIPKLSGINDDIIKCVYQVSDGKKNIQNFAITTEGLGKVYACPAPEKLKIIETQETSFIKMVSLPRCNNGDGKLCEQSKIELFSFFKDFVIPEGQEKSSYFNLKHDENQECIGTRSLLKVSVDGKVSVFKGEDNQEDRRKVLTHFTDAMIRGDIEKMVMIDPTDSQNRPMIFEWRGEREFSYQIYSYRFAGTVAGIDLKSSLINDHLDFVRGHNVIIPSFVNGLNRGFNKHKPVNEFGKLLIPPCSVANLVKKGEQVFLQCVYGDNKDPNMNIIIEGDISKNTQNTDCAIAYGKEKNRNLNEVLIKDNRVVVPSLVVRGDYDGDGDEEDGLVAPIIMICTEK